MSRIGAVGHVGAAQLGIIRRLSEIGSAIDQNTLRLATLKRINSAKDDPAGLIHAQILDSSLNAIRAASAGVARAQAYLNTADSAASSIVTQLEAARSLALEVAGGTLNPSEISANQTELNEILDAIDRLSRTEFNGRRLLDGSSGYRVTGINSSQIRDVDVQSKGTAGDVAVSINVTTTALQGTKSYAGGALGAATTLELTGPNGTTTINLADGATTQDIADAFNAVTYLTGIQATRVDATTVNFNTVKYGSAATIAINPLSGSFTTTGSGTGRDAVATINGASVTAEGTKFTYSSGNVVLQAEIDPAASGALETFTVSGSGMEFRVSTNRNDAARIGLPDLSTASLGGATGKLSSLRSGQANSLTGGGALTAIEIIDEALAEARMAQARVGGFGRYALGSAAGLLDAQEIELTAAYQDVMDVDVAKETAELSRNQLLKQAALRALDVSLFDQAHVLDLLKSALLRY
jgi:flagellin